MKEQTQGLRVWQKICYGLGDVTPTLSNTIIGFLYVFFLTDVVGLSATLAGTVFLLGSAWDAFTDPMAGYLSDITRSRLGKRRIYFLATALPYAVSFFLIWLPAPQWGQLGIFCYATATYMLYRTVSTLFIVPYTTYGMEIEEAYDGRTSLMGYRFFFSILLGLVAAAVPELITTLPLDPAVPAGTPSRAGYLLMAVIFSIPLVISPIVVFFAYREQPYNQSPRTSFRRRVLDTFRNKPFVQSLVIYMCAWMTIEFIQGLLIYYLNNVIGQGENFALIAGIILGMAVVSLPFWVLISKKLDKRKAYILGLGCFAALVLLLLLPAGAVNALLWYIIPVIGFAMGSMHMIPNALIPEAIEAGGDKYNSRSDGVYFGVVTCCEKLGMAILMQAALAIMDACGYISAESSQAVAQPDAAVASIRLLIALVPALLAAAGIFTASRFAIGRAESARLHDSL